MVQTLAADELRDRLDAQGYVIAEDVLDPENVIDPVLDAFAACISEYAMRVKHTRSYARLDLAGQLIKLVEQGQDWLDTGFDIALPPGGPYLPGVPLFLEREMFDLLTNDRLLDVIERILGPTIWLNPSAHTRMKVPNWMARRKNQRIGDTQWHQDAGVVLPEIDDWNMLTVWIPLTDAPLETGCLRVHPMPVDGALLDHCLDARNGIQIAASRMPQNDEVALPMKRGSVLFMRPRTPHASLTNVTPDGVRISLDLRYQPVGQPNGRPWMPSYLVRGADPGGGHLATYEEWRDGWLRTQRELVAKTSGEKIKFNRWNFDADVCA
jgi:phytanoyl-CoA hydroxylase